MNEEGRRPGAVPPTAAAAATVQGRTTPDVERELIAALASDVSEELRQRWPSYYANRSRGPAPALRLTPRQCGFSAIYRADFDFPDAGRESAIVKVRRQQKHGSFLKADLSPRTLALSRAEYAEHVKAYDFFAGGDPSLSVVRPLDFIESLNALVVAFAAGRDLSRLVKEGGPVASSAVERCGHWWRKYHHELHGAQHRDWHAAAMHAMLDRRFSRLEAIGAPADELAKLRDEIAAAVRRMPVAAIPVSLIHGDCKLRHVWATEQSIQVLDFGNAKAGDSWIDPAALVVELSLYSLWTRRMDSAPKVGDIRNLLHAYFSGPPPALFSFYVVDGLLKKWHRRLRHWGPGAGMTHLHRSLERARLAGPVARLYIDRWFTTQIRAWLALGQGGPPAWLEPILR